ncbi:hypothetical protein [Natrarchaeobaculum aegyptiacum]|nr:hypothetical protein [Natrarchaeobaculum aegyptiacum]
MKRLALFVTVLVIVAAIVTYVLGSSSDPGESVDPIEVGEN